MTGKIRLLGEFYISLWRVFPHDFRLQQDDLESDQALHSLQFTKSQTFQISLICGHIKSNCVIKVLVLFTYQILPHGQYSEL